MSDVRRHLGDSTPPKIQRADSNQSANDWANLRTLLLGAELEDRLKRPPLSAEDLGEILPDAILHAREHQEKVVAAVVPAVEDAIKSSVNRDLSVLSDSLFPVIGPATRKAVSVAIKNLTDSLNQSLEHSLSPQSFKWRFEAWRTGQTFAQVVMLRTLLYQVEQVLLIHKQTGLVLQDVEADTVSFRDPDLVSAMLTAIQDFVRDSFNVNTSRSLDKLEFDDLNIWIEDGPKAVLACVIQGVAPQDYQALMISKLEQLHVIFDRELSDFKGDQVPFESARPHLEDCLQSQFKATKKKKIPFLWIFLGLSFLGLICFFAWRLYQELQWQSTLRKLDDMPGIVILKNRENWGTYTVEGLRDPMAIDPKGFFKSEGYQFRSAGDQKDEITMRWEPYWSMAPIFLEARAKKLLDPPSTVRLSVNSELMLVASGLASHQWILQARQLSGRIDGVTGWNDSQVKISELERAKQLAKSIESQILIFDQGRDQLTEAADSTLEKIGKEIQMLTEITTPLGQTVMIEITGKTDSVGTLEENTRLGQSRAETVVQALIAQGIPPQHLKPKGSPPTQTQSAPVERESERRVSFQVSLTK